MATLLFKEDLILPMLALLSNGPANRKAKISLPAIQHGEISGIGRMSTTPAREKKFLAKKNRGGGKPVGRLARPRFQTAWNAAYCTIFPAAGKPYRKATTICCWGRAFRSSNSPNSPPMCAGRLIGPQAPDIPSYDDDQCAICSIVGQKTNPRIISRKKSHG